MLGDIGEMYSLCSLVVHDDHREVCLCGVSMMFERAYALISISWTRREHMTDEINRAVAQYDQPQAAASVACMTSDSDQVHLLIEYWRVRDAEQGDQSRGAGNVDPAPVERKPWRAHTKAESVSGPAERDQQAQQREPVGQTRRKRGNGRADDRESAGAAAGGVKEEDVPLPFDEARAIEHEFAAQGREIDQRTIEYVAARQRHPFTCGIHKSGFPIDCTCGLSWQRSTAHPEPEIEWP